MTLVEILVVLLLMALVVGGVVYGSGQTSGAQLKKSATLVTGAVRVAFTRANATSRPVRIAFDFEQKTVTLEESDSPMLVQTKDRTGTGGAGGATQAEQDAIAEGERLVKGPQAARPAFHPIAANVAGSDMAASPRPLGSGISFKSIQSAHDDEPRTSGRAYLYFWPGGLTERSAIQICVGDPTKDGDTLTLLVSPLTGKVTVKSGAVELPKPKDEDEASEREDRGT
jgi:general secretion pathway protein H